MSFVLKVIISGWLTAFAMIGFCALNESGMLVNIQKRIALWLESLSPRVEREPEEGLQPERENAA
jgi:hypothetical protein